MTTLDNSFCRPSTDQEWNLLDIDILAPDMDFKTIQDFYKWEDDNYIEHEIHWQIHDTCLVRIDGKLTLFKVTPCTAYCTNQSDWSTSITALNDNRFPIHKHKDNRTEISFQHYLDLHQDNITPWRLEEIGFIRKTDPWNIPYHIHEDYNITWHHRNKTIVLHETEMYNIKKFSQLQTLIYLKGGK